MTPYVDRINNFDVLYDMLTIGEAANLDGDMVTLTMALVEQPIPDIIANGVQASYIKLVKLLKPYGFGSIPPPLVREVNDDTLSAIADQFEDLSNKIYNCGEAINLRNNKIIYAIAVKLQHGMWVFEEAHSVCYEGNYYNASNITQNYQFKNDLSTATYSVILTGKLMVILGIATPEILNIGKDVMKTDLKDLQGFFNHL